MPPSIRRLACVALAVAACSWPGTASAATGGAGVPSADSSTTSAATGGASPFTSRATAHTKPAVKHSKHKRRKKKRKKKKRRSTRAPSTGSADSTADGPGVADIPSEYLALYKAAGAADGVSWRILAAIGKNESDHGRSTAPGVASGVNSAGCCSGPMQLCTTKSCGNTWSHYAVDGNGDGVTSVYDPADAIYSAAAMVIDLQTTLGTDPGPILAGYNAGPGAVRKYGGVPPYKETQGYVTHGLAYIATLQP